MLALTLVGAFCYSFNIHNPLFWDDADWILNNPSIHALTWTNIRFIFTHDALAGIGQISNYYRPFLFLTFLGNYIISGAAPVWYHVVSNTIHIGNGLLIFVLLARWLKSPRAAFIGALFFLIHPLQTEALTYVSGRGDPLSVFFMLSGIWLFIELRDRKRYLAAYAGSAVLMSLAVLSRETAVLFPGYLFMALAAFENSGPFFKRTTGALRTVLPLAGISALYGMLRLTVFNFQNTLNFYQHQNLYSEHLSYRIYTFLHALTVYLRLIIIPAGLHMDRDIPISLSILNPPALAGAGLILTAGIWLVYLYWSGRERLFWLWFFSLGVFFLNLGPTSGILPINARIYEHWLYISLFGAAALAGWYIDSGLRLAEKRHGNLKPALIILLIGYCLFMSIQTIRRNLIWGDPEALYQNILAYEPNDVRVLNNLGNWYSDHGQDSQAAPLYEKAIEADPSQPAPYHNLANIAAAAGDLKQAEALYKEAIRRDPRFHYAYSNLANIYLRENNIAAAINTLEELRKIFPSPELDAALERLKKSQR